MRSSRLVAGLAAAATAVTAQFDIPGNLLDEPLYGAPPNDFDCRSDIHPNPIILLHGLSANHEVDLNQLGHNLNNAGYCSFTLTYGAHPIPSWIGGLTAMTDSAVEIADFIRDVLVQTGAEKVDIVGHSEGGVMAIYVPLTQEGIADVVERNIALGPAIHGAQYFGFTDLFYIGGEVTRALVELALDTLGCPACDDMATGGDVYQVFAEASPIVQPGNAATIIMSTADTLVAPEISRIDEDGVRNIIIQDHCPDDAVGHAGLAWDTGVWDLIYNALDDDFERPIACAQGLPF